VIRDDDKPDAHAKLDCTVERTSGYVDLVRDYITKHPDKHFAIWCADGVSVEWNDRAVKINEYEPAFGISSNPRIIFPNGNVTEDRPDTPQGLDPVARGRMATSCPQRRKKCATFSKTYPTK
jgi:hypothetical protein